MVSWWESLDTALRILYCVAIPATVILVIQTVLTLIGFGNSDIGVDVSDVSGLDLDTAVDIDTDLDIPDDVVADGSNPADFSSLRLITVQTVIAFLTVFGWSSILTLQTGGKLWFALLIGCVLGFIAMFLLAKLVSLSAKLAENGTHDLHYALGQNATVYLPIPPTSQGTGKVTFTLQGTFTECEAMQEGNEIIPVGSQIRIIDISNNILVVEKL